MKKVNALLKLEELVSAGHMPAGARCILKVSSERFPEQFFCVAELELYDKLIFVGFSYEQSIMLVKVFGRIISGHPTNVQMNRFDTLSKYDQFVKAGFTKEQANFQIRYLYDTIQKQRLSGFNIDKILNVNFKSESMDVFKIIAQFIESGFTISQVIVQIRLLVHVFSEDRVEWESRLDSLERFLAANLSLSQAISLVKFYAEVVSSNKPTPNLSVIKQSLI